MNRQGYTLIELLVVVGVLTIVAACTMSMLVGSMSSFEGSTIQAQTDTDAVTAMQHIVSDVREAKSFSFPSGSTTLRLIKPIITEGGSYYRPTADTAHPVDYYRADGTGSPSRPGEYLWRSQGGQRRIVAKNIESIQFTSDEGAETRAVKITITAHNQSSAGERETNLTERVVYLRNY